MDYPALGILSVLLIFCAIGPDYIKTIDTKAHSEDAKWFKV
jgi:hypothetical protein